MDERTYPSNPELQDLTTEELEALDVSHLDGIAQRMPDVSKFPSDVQAALERASQSESTPTEILAILKGCVAPACGTDHGRCKDSRSQSAGQGAPPSRPHGRAHGAR